MHEELLSTWKDGTAKSAIVSFVKHVTAEGDREYVPPPERVAVFDNDGTLWCEKPMPIEPVRIWSRIGRRPILAFGNSNGDIPLLQFTSGQHRPRTAPSADARRRDACVRVRRRRGKVARARQVSTLDDGQHQE